MKRTVAIIGLLIVIGGIAVLLMGCPPPVVRARPPGAKSGGIWTCTLPGCCLETWQLGTSGRGLGLDTRSLDEASQS